MTPQPKGLLATVVIGLFVGGPVAAIALAAVPAGWQGPLVPAVAGIASILAVALLRHGAGRPPRYPESGPDKRHDG